MYKRIRFLREDSDHTQTELANLLNCTQECYSRYESGAREIPITALISLSSFYSTSVDYILGLTDEMRPYPRSADKELC